MRLPHYLIAIDLETTDSDSKAGSIIQLSAIVVNEAFEPIHTRIFDMYVQPLDNYRNLKAMAVNKISEETLRLATPLQEALIMFESFCDKDNILASWGAYFDIPFLKKQYEKIYREYPFSYHCFDLKSVAIWELAKRNIPLRSGVSKFLDALHKEFKGVHHNAFDDIQNAVDILRYCKNA